MNSIKEQGFSAAVTGPANASMTTKIQASALRKGGLVNVQGHPCEISAIMTQKSGRHTKVSLEAYDIFTHQKFEEISRAHAPMDVPVVVRREYLLLMVEDGYLSLLDIESGDTKEDVKLPEAEIGERMLKLIEKDGKDVMVVVLGAMGFEKAVDFKEVDRV